MPHLGTLEVQIVTLIERIETGSSKSIFVLLPVESLDINLGDLEMVLENMVKKALLEKHLIAGSFVYNAAATNLYPD